MCRTSVRVNLSAILAVVFALHSPLPADDRLLALMPDDALAFVGIPLPRQLNDSLLQMLDGMDRSTGMFGARPIDPIKSLLNISVAIDERRPAAIVLVPRRDQADGVEIVWLVPVTDEGDFLRGNFTDVRFLAGENDADDVPSISRVQHSGFGELHARAAGQHMLLSRRPEPLIDWRATGQFADRLTQRLDAAGRRTLRTGDIVIWVRDFSCNSWGPTFARWLDRIATWQPAFEQLRAFVSALPLDHAADCILTIDHDPLGMFVRGWARMTGEVVRDARRVVPADRRGHFGTMPREPYMLASGFDERGLTLIRSISRRLGGTMLADSLDVLRDVNQLDFVAYADSRSGLLGRSTFVMHSGSAAPDDDLQRAMSIWQDAGHTVQWRQRTPAAGEHTQRQHECEVRLAADAPQPLRMLWPIAFGGAGWQGTVVAEDGAAAMVFSRARPAVEAAQRALAGIGPALGDDPVLRSMRAWMPENPAIEVYVRAGALFEHVRPLVLPLFTMADLRVPDVPQALPPMAAAVTGDGATAEFTVIVPAGVLAIAYDLTIDSVIRRHVFTPEQADDQRE
jgi:hypothetical protein